MDFFWFRPFHEFRTAVNKRLLFTNTVRPEQGLTQEKGFFLCKFQLITNGSSKLSPDQVGFSEILLKKVLTSDYHLLVCLIVLNFIHFGSI